MFDQGHNRVAVLMHELETAFAEVVTNDGLFCEMRRRAREIAVEYPEFIVWSPERHDTMAVSDIWDRAWNRIASVEVPMNERMISAPLW